jgi:AGCS family alanine or glycine:cation symporter
MFMSSVFKVLEVVNNYLWGYVGAALILSIGFYLSYKARWVQIRKFSTILWYFLACFGKAPASEERGTSPLKVFFASLGGCIGIGNLVTVAVAIQLGGPGALVWVWIVALFGMILKYAEIYLGVIYRTPNDQGGYDGGPMYFLRKAFPNQTWLSYFMAVLLCLYGIEVYMFGVIKESISINWGISPLWTAGVLLVLVLIGVSGGVQRIGSIATVLIPLCVLVFFLMTCWVLFQNASKIPAMLFKIVVSAFTGHAAVGGFIGSTMALTVSKGISSACYSGDVGIGYASIIHSEARTNDPKQQASLSVFGIFIDTFVICTCTMLLILVTDTWHQPMEASLLVQTALSKYFPYMDIFMPLFLFILGYTAILPYMCAGMKCANYIFPTYGVKLYYLFGIFCFGFFAFFESYYALIVMNISGGMLMMINLPAILKLQDKIDFKL